MHTDQDYFDYAELIGIGELIRQSFMSLRYVQGYEYGKLTTRPEPSPMMMGQAFLMGFRAARMGLYVDVIFQRAEDGQTLRDEFYRAFDRYNRLMVEVRAGNRLTV